MREHIRNYEFIGPFKDIIPQYIKYKRSLGFKYDNRMELPLKHIDDFFLANGQTEVTIKKEIAEKFIERRDNESARTQHARQSSIRQLGIYLKQIGYEDVYIFPKNEFVNPKSSFVPHIYTNEEMEKIFHVLDNMQNYHFIEPNQNIYPMLIRMLYGCGLRLSEALSLKINDVDLINGIIHVNNAKNNTSRLVPMSDSLKKYAIRYSKIINWQATVYFYPAPDRRMYNRCAVGTMFRKVLKDADIPRNSSGLGPRLHDLRHTFAVHSLGQMISYGQDIYCALPTLSVYLGHKGIESTEKYLRLTKEYFKDIINATAALYENVFPEVMLDEE